ncbi:MAG: hypothetical protein KC635_21245, partial [Myxococcales bacterium]|nr:hypothetical protein [Myxococcales bacterium]
TVRWEATLTVEAGAEGAAVAVARADVAVVAATLDGAPTGLEAKGGYLLARVRGRGKHVVGLVLDTPTRRGEGPTGTDLWTPAPPVLAFTLVLEGDKEVTADPAGGVERTVKDGQTTARVWLPATEEVAFHWTEALPEGGERELRANADIVHVVRADEGVLQIAAWVTFEVARGKAHGFALTVPEAAAVNAVHGDGITDWRMSDPVDGKRTLSLYLDREVTGSYACRVEYELLVDPASAEAHAVPLLTAENVGRQRGMVALVRGTELEIAPARVDGLAAVGENQLPVGVREQIDQKVTHTYKYAEPGGALLVRLSPFERELARFDAAVDTLYSLGEGVLRAAASIEVTVKAGSFADLEVALPAGINVLSATAPSLREHRVVEPAAAGGARTLALAFTREMEGTVRIEVVWEKVLAPGDGPLEVPLLHVPGAVVEQGRLGVEALSAVEVRPTEAERLLPMDVQELPQKLVLRTTNPILLAYHYVHADPPAKLVLSVKRHAEIAVQVAAIDRADYQTLWTRDGVALTRARYVVRNRGKQFLRVALPPGASVWSAELAGQPVKPAKDDEDTVLVPLLNATDPFEVVLVYLVKGEPLGFAGRVEATLPAPDLVETEATWDVYLPEDLAWGEVETNMTVVARPEEGASAAPPSDVTATAGDGAREVSGQAGVSPLRIHVPERGKRLVLRKLLANQGAERATFSIRYRGEGAGGAGAALVLFGALALGLLALRLTARGARTGRAT